MKQHEEKFKGDVYVNFDKAEKIYAYNEQDLAGTFSWKSVLIGGNEEHYLVIPLHKKKEVERIIQGDFMIKFESGKCKFYCWHNVGAII